MDLGTVLLIVFFVVGIGWIIWGEMPGGGGDGPGWSSGSGGGFDGGGGDGGC